MAKRIYLDHAATTPLAKAAFKVMAPYFFERYGNPSSSHQDGRAAKAAVDIAREKVAAVLNCQPQEVIFTATGTESNNLVLRGLAEANNFSGHIITTAIEHSAVFATARYLSQRGVAVTFVPTGEYGQVDPRAIFAAVRPDTFLVSVIYANNEFGAIQPLGGIGKALAKQNILFHTDAVQAPGLLPLDVKKLRVNFMSLSAHKFYGPKGVGILYAQAGTKLIAQQTGGGQEFGLRSATENVPGIVGAAEALVMADEARSGEAERLSGLRDWLVNEISARIPGAVLAGHPTDRLPNNVLFCFPGLEGEHLVMRLCERGFACSSGSACATGHFEPSRALLALGLPRATALASLRVSLGRSTKKKDLKKFVKVLKEEVEKISPPS